MTGLWRVIEKGEPMDKYVDIRDVEKHLCGEEGYHELSKITYTIHFMQEPRVEVDGVAYMATLPDVQVEPTGIMHAKGRKKIRPVTREGQARCYGRRLVLESSLNGRDYGGECNGSTTRHLR